MKATRQLKDEHEGVLLMLRILGEISRQLQADGRLENVALQSRAKLVVPIHVDNFFKPLEDGMAFLPTVKFGEFCRKAEKYRAIFMIRTLPFCKEIKILPLNPSPATNANMR